MRRRRQEGSVQEAHETFGRLLEQVTGFLRRRWRLISPSVVAVVVLATVFYAYHNKLLVEETQSWREAAPILLLTDLMGMGGSRAAEVHREVVQACRSILESRWRTSATPWVLLKLANAEYALGRLNDAVETYETLLAEHRAAPASTMARPSYAALLEDLGRYDEAAQVYEALAEDEQGISRFWIDAGRSRELALKKDLAQKNYRRFLDSNGAAGLRKLARARLRFLEEGRMLPAYPVGKRGGEDRARAEGVAGEEETAPPVGTRQ